MFIYLSSEMIMRHSFPFFFIDEFNPPHKTQWKSNVAFFQQTVLRVYYIFKVKL